MDQQNLKLFMQKSLTFLVCCSCSGGGGLVLARQRRHICPLLSCSQGQRRPAISTLLPLSLFRLFPLSLRSDVHPLPLLPSAMFMVKTIL